MKVGSKVKLLKIRRYKDDNGHYHGHRIGDIGVVMATDAAFGPLVLVDNRNSTAGWGGRYENCVCWNNNVCYEIVTRKESIDFLLDVT